MKTKQPTPFYLAAERFANIEYLSTNYGACEVLYNQFPQTRSYKNCPCVGDKIHKDYFRSLFRPSMQEEEDFLVDPFLWMESYNQTEEQNRQDRIIALLFADLMWQDEQSKSKNQ